jgi:hypothetical protein
VSLDAIAALWALEPQLPLSAIASELGATRGAIAGRIQRARRAGDLRFGPRPPGNQHGSNAASDRQPRLRPSKPKRVVEPAPVVEPLLGLVKIAGQADAPVLRETGVSLIELAANGCRYPVNESGPIRFCGARCEFGKSWCSRHAAIVRSGPSSVLPRASSAVAASRPQGSV